MKEGSKVLSLRFTLLILGKLCCLIVFSIFARHCTNWIHSSTLLLLFFWADNCSLCRVFRFGSFFSAVLLFRLQSPYCLDRCLSMSDLKTLFSTRFTAFGAGGFLPRFTSITTRTDHQRVTESTWMHISFQLIVFSTVFSTFILAALLFWQTKKKKKKIVLLLLLFAQSELFALVVSALVLFSAHRLLIHGSL